MEEAYTAEVSVSSIVLCIPICLNISVLILNKNR